MQTVLKKNNIQIRLGCSSIVMSSLPDGSVDLILCDPPYGTTNHQWDKAPDLARQLAEFDRLLAPGGRAIIFSAHPFTAAVAAAIVESKKWHYYELIWVKTVGSNQLNCSWRPLQKHENIFVVYRRGEATKGHYQPQVTPGKPYKKSRNPKGDGYGKQRAHIAINDGTRQPTTILNFANPRKKDHPTSKPVDLLAYLMRQYSAPEALVLDPFMGGGNSAVAAKNEGRKYVGVESNETYFHLAKTKLKTKKTIKKLSKSERKISSRSD